MKIKKARIAAGLSQAEVADAIGVNQATYSRIENGNQRITVDQLLAIAKVLGVPFADLVDKRKAA